MTITKKIIFLVILLIFLTIAVSLIHIIVYDREQNMDKALRPIYNTYLQSPLITSPYLEVEVEDTTKIIPKETAKDAEDGKKQNELIYKITFSDISANVDMKAITKNKSNYSAVVYDSNIILEGNMDLKIFYDLMKERKQNIKAINLIWSIRNNNSATRPLVKVNGVNKDLYVKNSGRNNSYYYMPINLDELKNNKSLEFLSEFALKGSGSFNLRLYSIKSKIDIFSDWPHPSFVDNLPDTRTITKDGFDASWQTTSNTASSGIFEVSHISNYKPYIPDYSTYKYNSDYSYNSYDDENGFKTISLDLVEEKIGYNVMSRSIKYSFFVLALALIVFFTLDSVARANAHMVQYMFIGATLVVFYLLFLGLLEHMPYGVAYFTAALACTALLTFYSIFVFKNRNIGLILGFLMVGIYFIVYNLLSFGKYMFLIGSIFVFLILAVMMFLTRNIDWNSEIHSK